MYLGNFRLDDTCVFAVNTSSSTGAATDADSVPTYRVYEDETGTSILTGSMAKLDDANTTGYYSEQITLSAANGFEVGKSYNIYISAAVGGVTGATNRRFQVAGTSANILQLTTIATLTSQTVFTLTAGSADNDAYNKCVAIITDAATSVQKAVAVIGDYVGSTKTVTLAADPGVFTMAAGDAIAIIAPTTSTAPSTAPVQGVVNDRIRGTTITLYQGETHSQSVTLTDADGNAVDLTAYSSPKITIESKDKTELQVATVTISGAGNNVFSWTVLAAVTAKPNQQHKYSLRDATTHQVISFGIIDVQYQPLDD